MTGAPRSNPSADKLARLRRSDAVRGTHYVMVVRAVLDCAGNVGSAANMLGINQETFKSLLAAAVNHAGLELRDPLERLELRTMLSDGVPG